MAEETSEVTEEPGAPALPDADEVAAALADAEPGEVPEHAVAHPQPRRQQTKSGAVNKVGIRVELSVVLGRASMPIHQLLKMGRGAVIELGAHVDAAAAIYANNRLIAQGQVVVVGENTAVLITETVPITET